MQNCHTKTSMLLEDRMEEKTPFTKHQLKSHLNEKNAKPSVSPGGPGGMECSVTLTDGSRYTDVF